MNSKELFCLLSVLAALQPSLKGSRSPKILYAEFSSKNTLLHSDHSFLEKTAKKSDLKELFSKKWNQLGTSYTVMLQIV